MTRIMMMILSIAMAKALAGPLDLNVLQAAVLAGVIAFVLDQRRVA